MQEIKKRRLVRGIGIYDSDERVLGNKCYLVWASMLERCNSERWKRLYPTYADCSVCEEWKTYSRFKEWFDENYIEGYDLDKDLFSQGSKIYSPQTCVFLPPEINKILLCKGRNNGLKLGVCRYRTKYRAVINTGYTRNLGLFNTEDEAHEAYVAAKKKHIRVTAKYCYSRGEISKKVYDALLNYQIPQY